MPISKFKLDDPLTVLVADDNDSDRMILKSVIGKQGHAVIAAKNGQEAIDMYLQHNPHIILMDAMMPVLSGFEAAKEIKSLAEDNFIPIIFLTSLDNTGDLVACLEAGGDDFLSKPYNNTMLKAKMRAFNRMRIMHHAIREQKNTIERRNKQMLWEQKNARAIFDKIIHNDILEQNNIKYHQTPYALFNGDIIVGALKPCGDFHVFIGDFTGHGLPAAMGALPLAEIFYDMTAKNSSMNEILIKINARLKEILPVSCFCCAAMMEVNFRHKYLKIWQGGLPDTYLLRNNGAFQVISSFNLPLGILDTKSFKPKSKRFELDNEDRIYLWTDGLIESESREKELFGEQRLLEVFKEEKKHDEIFEKILKKVISFCGKPSDDLTMIELKMVDVENIFLKHTKTKQDKKNKLVDFDFNFFFDCENLKNYENPIPEVARNLAGVFERYGNENEIYLVLTELYANALEHGVLGMDSFMKEKKDGFSHYYDMRAKKLQNLSEGFIKLSLDFKCRRNKSELIIEVEDSGDGFDYKKNLNLSKMDAKFSGRGLRLVHSLCHRLAFKGHGNKVQAQFLWSES